MTRIRTSDVAAIVLAVAIIGSLGFLPRPGPSGPALAPPTSSADPAGVDDTADGTSVLFIGDSYTAGSGVAELSYGCQAAVLMRWLCQVSAVPGTGYISGGPANRFTVDPYIGLSTSFGERIPGLAMRYRPTIVVLDGGRNDTFPPRADVFTAMAATIAEVRRVWPAASIAFIRPRFLDEPADDLGFDRSFVERLKAKSGVMDLVVLDPIVRLRGTDTQPYLARDRIHPNRDGERVLADALHREFRSHEWAGTL